MQYAKKLQSTRQFASSYRVSLADRRIATRDQLLDLSARSPARSHQDVLKYGLAREKNTRDEKLSIRPVPSVEACSKYFMRKRYEFTSGGSSVSQREVWLRYMQIGFWKNNTFVIRRGGDYNLCTDIFENSERKNKDLLVFLNILWMFHFSPVGNVHYKIITDGSIFLGKQLIRFTKIKSLKFPTTKKKSQHLLK